MQLNILLKDGRWLVNGKQLKDMNDKEQKFMNGFFKTMKCTPEYFRKRHYS